MKDHIVTYSTPWRPMFVDCIPNKNTLYGKRRSYPSRVDDRGEPKKFQRLIEFCKKPKSCRFCGIPLIKGKYYCFVNLQAGSTNNKYKWNTTTYSYNNWHGPSEMNHFHGSMEDYSRIVVCFSEKKMSSLLSKQQSKNLRKLERLNVKMEMVFIVVPKTAQRLREKIFDNNQPNTNTDSEPPPNKKLSVVESNNSFFVPIENLNVERRFRDSLRSGCECDVWHDDLSGRNFFSDIMRVTCVRRLSAGFTHDIYLELSGLAGNGIGIAGIFSK
uniref:Uncharacterized protein n=1 Tax=Romanomermis culicivorax TaxID=13658 RepID=A0A915K8K0_ROMCU